VEAGGGQSVRVIVNELESSVDAGSGQRAAIGGAMAYRVLASGDLVGDNGLVADMGVLRRRSHVVAAGGGDCEAARLRLCCESKRTDDEVAACQVHGPVSPSPVRLRASAMELQRAAPARADFVFYHLDNLDNLD
jgi:hypothetical protein